MQEKNILNFTLFSLIFGSVLSSFTFEIWPYAIIIIFPQELEHITKCSQEMILTHATSESFTANA